MTREHRDLLYFGYGLAVIATGFMALGTLKHGYGWPQMVLAACALVFFLVTTLRWEALRPGYRGWMKAAHAIGAVVTTLILAVVFFLVFAPVGILFRMIGKDHLQRKLDRQASSYWHKRPEDDQPRESYLQQY